LPSADLQGSLPY